MIYYMLNENNEITRDDFNYFEGALSMPEEDYRIVNGYNGALFFEEYTHTEEYKQKERQWNNEHEIKDLRRRRESECFSVINRGYLWYAQLTEQQLAELNAWYSAWLNVTETAEVPDKPDWLK